MKLILGLLLFVLTSCAYTVVLVKHPVPKMRRDLSGFNSELIGEYTITDTLIDEDFFEAVNELYDPEIKLDMDSSVFIMAQMKVVISEHLVLSKKTFTAFMYRSFYNSQAPKLYDEIDTVIFLNDTVKIVLNEKVDTLFNNQNQDLLRKYKDHYLLNKSRDGAYQPILLTETELGSWQLMDLDENRLVDYYNSFDHEKSEAKANLVYAEEPITLKNSELRDLIQDDYFTVRYSLSKKTIKSNP